MAKDIPKGTDKDSNNKAAALKRGNNYVLAIAIDEYPEQPLNNCVRDMQEFSRILLQYQHFEESRFHYLVNSQATRMGVISKIRELNELLTVDDSLIVYFSGHGKIDDKLRGAGFWLTSGCNLKNYFIDGLSNTELLQYIKMSEARHIVLLVDSCFSGSLFYSSRDLKGAERLDELEKYDSRWAITAGHLEPVSDGPSGFHSPFAEHLIGFLKKTTHTDGMFSVSDLSKFLRRAVTANSRQSPDGRPLFDVGDEGGEFVFYLKGVDAPEITPKPAEIDLDNLSKSIVVEPIMVQEAVVDNTAIFNEIRELVAKANLEIALQKLVTVEKDAIVLLQSYNTAKRENMMGLLTHDEWFRRRNQISYSILEMLK